MPTANDWMTALLLDHEVNVESSNKLVRDVRRRQTSYYRKALHSPPTKVNISQVNSIPPSFSIDIKAIDLLHSIGIITAPAVPNLVSLCATSAILRYLWAFEINSPGPNNPLALSIIEQQIDTHQKQLFSDELGMGMARYLMVNIFNARNHFNTLAAFDCGLFGATPQLKGHPDFIFFDDFSKNIYVVECKGNQSSYSATIDQIRRGAEQVPAVKLGTGIISQSLVIATYISNKETSIYILDPPVSDNMEGKDESFTLEVKNEKGYHKSAELLNRSKLLTYAGLDEDAFSQLPDQLKESTSSFPRRKIEPSTVETRWGDYIGSSESIIDSAGERIELFRGIHKNLLNNMRGDLTSKERGFQHISTLESPYRLAKDKAFEAERENNVVYSRSSEGTIFRLVFYP